MCFFYIINGVPITGVFPAKKGKLPIVNIEYLCIYIQNIGNIVVKLASKLSANKKKKLTS